ncbi:MAG: hypothetical protein H0V54_13650 [Chthoniobacterales bacterium]|nr:hypothetical protein [Chthoniobacterales bacterium]
MKKGDRARVAKSWSSDVNPGAEGVVVKRMRGGYAINIEGWFTNATGQRNFGTRCMFFSAAEVKKTSSARPPQALKTAEGQSGGLL